MRVLAVLALVAAAPEPAPDPAPVALASAPGPFRAPVRQLLLAPYADATGTTLIDAAWDGTAAGLKPATADLALLDAPTLAAACAAHAIERIDWDRLVRERFVGPAATDCGAGVGLAATALAWDRDKLPGMPNWGDFWDVAKHPGRRGLQRTARGALEIALLADGVGPGDVYRTLRTAEGVDRAFRKLDQLKPYLEWWDNPAQPAQFLASGRVLLTSAPAAAIAAANAAPVGPKAAARHFGMQWQGSLLEPLSLAIVHGAPHPDAAMTALVIASDVARQAQFAEATGLGPANVDALDLLPAAFRAASPSLPANAGAGLAMDDGFWSENGPKLEPRFQAWMAK